jgi:hypothetical protein
MQNSLIADIRAMTFWDYVTPEWDGITIPKPKPEMAPVRYEIQVQRVIIGENGEPALSDWMAIPSFDVQEKITSAEPNKGFDISAK